MTLRTSNAVQRSSPFLVAGLLFVVSLSGVASGDDRKLPRFESDVRPIFKAHCWQCHGEEAEVKGGFDLRLARFLLKGGDSGPAVVPGEHGESLLYQRVAAGEMPPGKKKLSA